MEQQKFIGANTEEYFKRQTYPKLKHVALEGRKLPSTLTTEFKYSLLMDNLEKNLHVTEKKDKQLSIQNDLQCRPVGFGSYECWLTWPGNHTNPCVIIFQ